MTKNLRLKLAAVLVFSAFLSQAQTTYTFTNCGATGRYGPTQTQVDNTYGSTNTLYNAVTSNNGVQYWIVPNSGDYSIEAFGAEGGGNGGEGAEMYGEFNLTAGDTLRIIAGQMGVDGSGGTTNYNGGGGGGGSFVIQTPYNNTASILVIAGGGGGGLPSNQGGNGNAGTSGDDIYQSGGGTSGNGGSNGITNGEAAGGGGFFTNGQNSANTSQNPCQGGLAFVNGANGGESGTNGSYFGGHGGFGGGGSGWHNSLNRCGGGGGYSGGQGGSWSANPAGPGGGAGSYNSGTNQSNSTGGNTGHGYVVITSLYGVSISETSTLDCYGDDDAALMANGFGGSTPYTYSWSTGGTTQSVSNLTAGTYTVTMTDNNSQTTVSSYTVVEPGELDPNLTIASIISCHGSSDGEITADVLGGTTPFTYTWSTTETTDTISGLSAGTYTVTVEDSNGCDSIASISITQPDSLIGSTSVEHVSCNGLFDGSVMASAIGGTTPYTYAWSNSATTATVSNLTSASYTVTISDSNACADTITVLVEEPEVLNAVLVGSDVVCLGENSGSISTTTTGGTTPYSYIWSNGNTTSTATMLVAGVYSVIVTDSSGCMDIKTMTISEPTEALSLTLSVDEEVVCEGDLNGEISSTVSGGWGGYVYNWSSTDTSANASNLTDGTYSLTVTDSNGCEVVEEATINYQFEQPEVDLGTDSILCEGFSITLDAGNAGSTYSWSSGETTQTLVVTAAGNYSVDVTSADGCVGTASIAITSDPCLSVDELNQGSMTLYPNPTNNGLVYLEMHGVERNVDIQVVDLMGKQLLVKENVAMNGSPLAVNIDQPAGVYFIVVRTEHQIFTERVVLQ